MSRGRPPAAGIDLALPVAHARGRVMQILQSGDCPAIFVIVAGSRVFFVSVHRADPFRMSPAELEAEYRAMITMIRSLPAGTDIIREAWFYSRSGSLRFFRVEETWLLEIGRDGNPLGEPVPEMPVVVKDDGKEKGL